MSLAARWSGVLQVLPADVGLDQDRFFDRVAARDRLGRAIAEAALVAVIGSAAYGATFGLWRSGLLAVYVAIKLPLLLLATSALVMVLNWMLAELVSSGLGFVQVAALTYRAMAVAGVVLLSLAPISGFLAISCPPPSPLDDLPHHLLLLTHVGLVGCAGLYGNAAIFEGLRRLSRPRTQVRALYLMWLASNMFVGGQLAWILRPFLGSPNYPVLFLRASALEGNFYEFVCVTIIWKHLLGGG